MDARKLVVSFHDLHPGSMACCERFLGKLEALGAPRASLLVVPDWYGRAPLCNHPAFCGWLRALPHDIALHGWAHVATHRPQSPADWLVANLYTAGEGEFFRLPPSEAERLVARGLEMFRDCGLRAGGFVAPAWLMEESLVPVLTRCGLEYAVTLSRVLDLRSGRRLFAPVLCTTSRTPLRRALTRAVVARLAAKHADAPVLRIAVHPVDLRHPRIEAFICQLIARALETRTPATYSDLVTAASCA